MLRRSRGTGGLSGGHRGRCDPARGCGRLTRDRLTRDRLTRGGLTRGGLTWGGGASGCGGLA